MRILIVEDDTISATVLRKYLESVGQVDVASDGNQGIKAFRGGIDAGQPHELVCLDIMMPEVDGQGVLKAIRAYETERGIPKGCVAKAIMTTSMDDKENVMTALPNCDAYLTKPIDKGKLWFYLGKLGLLGGVGR